MTKVQDGLVPRGNGTDTTLRWEKETSCSKKQKTKNKKQKKNRKIFFFWLWKYSIFRNFEISHIYIYEWVNVIHIYFGQFFFFFFRKPQNCVWTAAKMLIWVYMIAYDVNKWKNKFFVFLTNTHPPHPRNMKQKTPNICDFPKKKCFL